MQDLTHAAKAIEEAGGYHRLMSQLNTAFRREEVLSILDGGGFPAVMAGLLQWCRKNGWEEAAAAFEAAAAKLP